MYLFSSIFAEANPMRDLWELLSFKATVITALLTLAGGVVTAALAVRQSRKDYRWKQAELARSLLDDIFDDPPSNDAWRMVDGEELYEDEQGNKYQITMADVRRALPRPWNDDKGGKDVYIRWCFDDLFYYLERLESSVHLKL